jgi:hypothetical protein
MKRKKKTRKRKKSGLSKEKKTHKEKKKQGREKNRVVQIVDRRTGSTSAWRERLSD